MRARVCVCVRARACVCVRASVECLCAVVELVLRYIAHHPPKLRAAPRRVAHDHHERVPRRPAVSISRPQSLNIGRKHARNLASPNAAHAHARMHKLTRAHTSTRRVTHTHTRRRRRARTHARTRRVYLGTFFFSALLTPMGGGQYATGRDFITCGECARRCHICSGTGIAPATSAPGLGSPPPHLRRDHARLVHTRARG